MSHNTLDNKFIELPSSALVVSLILHGSLLFCVMSVRVLDKMGIQLFEKKKDVTKQMYQSFIQVDVVGLPQQLVNQQNVLDTTLPVVAKPKITPEDTTKIKAQEQEMKLAKEAAEKKVKEEEFAESQQKAKEKDAKEKKEKETKAKEAEQAAKEKKQKLEKEKALKQLELDAKREQALKGLQSKAGKSGRGKMVGNVLSQGTAATGAIGNAKDRYAGLIAEEIKRHFNIYLWQKKKDLSAEIFLELTPTGKMIGRKITKPSKESLYDSAVLQAADQSTFPVPEDPSILSGGVYINLTP